MVPFVAAAIQVPPVTGPLTPESVKANLDTCVDQIDRCVAATGAELLVLPEAATTGFTPGLDADALWDLVSEIPGPVTEPVQEVARRLGVHVVLGTYERGPQRGTVYNTAVVIGPAGGVLGRYRKTHLFCGEDWVTAGDRAVGGETPPARVGLMNCLDGDYPELARIEAAPGAEVICPPPALLRAAAIWGLTNRGRAYDNHRFVVGANATCLDPA